VLFIRQTFPRRRRIGQDWILHKAGMEPARSSRMDDLPPSPRTDCPRVRGRSGAMQGGRTADCWSAIMLTSIRSWYSAGHRLCGALLDMKRYRGSRRRRLDRAYGDPDKPEDWAFLPGNFAYHHVEQARHYPPILADTSARDDACTPALTARWRASSRRSACRLLL